MKMTDMKMTESDQFAELENVGHEKAGHEKKDQKWRQGVKLQDRKYSVNKDYITVFLLLFFKHNAVIYTVCKWK